MIVITAMLINSLIDMSYFDFKYLLNVTLGRANFKSSYTFVIKQLAILML